VYGRSFGTAPILGRLGMDSSFADLARQVAPYERAIEARVRPNRVVVAVHLIYGLATPCSATPNCLLYLDEQGVDIVHRYIEPAAKRGWLVILDDQLGRSNPVGEMDRLIARGYMRYDNVEVAFDPEFRTLPGQYLPGVPVGSVTARELNVAQFELGRYARGEGLPHRKLMLVHQWSKMMIRHRGRLRTDVRGVQPVSVMDAFGPPADKTSIYHQLLDRRAAQPGLNAGIKLFPPNPYERAGHLDMPMLNWNQLFGKIPVVGNRGFREYLSPVPRVIVLT
jgi:hypothetical protein